MQTEREGKMSGFGYYVFELMSRREMSRQSELAGKLRDGGYDVKKPQNLSNWLRGTQPPLAFVRALVDILDLSEMEETTLYAKFVRESKKRVA